MTKTPKALRIVIGIAAIAVVFFVLLNIYADYRADRAASSVTRATTAGSTTGATTGGTGTQPQTPDQGSQQTPSSPKTATVRAMSRISLRLRTSPLVPTNGPTKTSWMRPTCSSSH